LRLRDTLFTPKILKFFFVYCF